MMKYLKKIVVFTLAAAMASQMSFVSAASSDVKASLQDEIQGTTETFDNATQVYQDVEGLYWDKIGELGTKLSFWNPDNHINYVGAKDDGTGNKVLHMEDDIPVDLSVLYEQPVFTNNGIFRLRFDMKKEAKTDVTVKFRIAEWDEYNEYNVNMGTRFVISNQNGSWKTLVPLGITDGGWASLEWAEGVGGDSIGVGAGFASYEMEINPCNPEMNGEQTITYYVNGKKGNTYTIYPVVNGVETKQRITHIDGMLIGTLRGKDAPNIDFDNLSLTADKGGSNSICDDFNTAATISPFPDGTLWHTAAGKHIWAYGSMKNGVYEFRDGNVISPSQKNSGDQVLYSEIKQSAMVTYMTNEELTLAKGDKFSLSFEYFSGGEARPRADFHLNMHKDNSSGGAEANAAGPAFIYESLMKPGLNVTNNNFVVFAIHGQDIRMAGDWDSEVIGRLSENAFDRIDMILDTCDESAGGKQTLSMYLNGNLMDKGTFYAKGENGESVNEPVSKISNPGCSIRSAVESNSSGVSICALDNIWLLKSPGNLQVLRNGQSINGQKFTPGEKLTLQYERPSLYRQGDEEKILVAAYDENNMLTGCTLYPVIPNQRITTQKIDAPEGVKMKAYLWESSMAPLTPGEELLAAVPALLN